MKMNRNVSNVQESMDKYAARVFDLGYLETRIKLKKAILLATIATAQEALSAIDEAFAEELDNGHQLVSEAKEKLETYTLIAWETHNFPEGKRRLPLESGAYVNVSERVTYHVKDSQEVIRWALVKGIEDTLIASVKLDKDATKGAWSLFGKIHGVEEQTRTAVSIKLPKEGK